MCWCILPPPSRRSCSVVWFIMQVRDALGLTYDVSFELSLYDRLRTGWFVCHVTSTHAKIDEALDASLRVLRSLPLQRVTPRELLRAKRTVLLRHESEMKVQFCCDLPKMLSSPPALHLLWVALCD